MLIVDPQTYDMEIDAGDQEKVQFNLFNADGSAFNGSGSAFAFIAKRSLDDAIGSAAINISSGAQPSQWDFTNIATGIVILEFLAANTNALGAVKLHYGLKVTDAVANVHTVRSALFLIKKNPVI